MSKIDSECVAEYQNYNYNFINIAVNITCRLILVLVGT